MQHNIHELGSGEFYCLSWRLEREGDSVVEWSTYAERNTTLSKPLPAAGLPTPRGNHLQECDRGSLSSN